ncbi:DUF6587 family protein [Novacetimonas hansenii]|uniref:DUF6587 family protein n=1 Tax=Novacetimonas hansenii TaxID=436 RepID=UPI00248D5C25|nr:DUF6587 family protein [Novacetimonas hansenii]
MIQSLLVTGVVMACVLYWTGRLFPRVRLAGWRMTATALRHLGAPRHLRDLAMQRAIPRTGGGCGGCSACAETRRACPPDTKQTPGQK